jgi:hypothetical protein
VFDAFAGTLALCEGDSRAVSAALGRILAERIGAGGASVAVIGQLRAIVRDLTGSAGEPATYADEVKARRYARGIEYLLHDAG